MRRTLLSLLILSCCVWQGLAQVTTEGKEFWFAFMQNNDGGNSSSSLEAFFTSKEEANVEIFLYQDGTTQTFTVTPGQTVKRIINASNNNPYAASGSGNIQGKGIRVTSDVPISVYAFNNRSFSGDAAVVLPINTLGKKYYVSSYYEAHEAGDSFASGPSQSQFVVVATVDDTAIDIVPKVQTTDGKAAGELFTITLNQGEVYQLQAEGDLTGSLIESASQNEDDCKNFAVFGGNVWTRVTGDDDCATFNGASSYPGGFAADHLYEQMYPVKTWGRAYTAVSYELRTGYVLRVTASENSTTVNIGGTSINLNAGQYTTVFEQEVSTISADKPIQVAQFSQSLSCDSKVTTGPGDPFMIMLSPDEQQLKEITFNALSTNQITDYFVTLITPTTAIGDLLINDVPAQGNQLFTSVANSTLSYTALDVTKGADLTIKSATGFIAYVYGFGNIESFGYVAGASLENLNLEVVGDDETIGVIVQEGCVNSEVSFDVDFEQEPGQAARYTVFDWDFGDGNTATGQNVSHTYTMAGIYEITLVASDGGGACGNSETVTRSVTITETTVDEMTGPVSVCPDVSGVIYQVSGPADNTYEWFIQGGTITNQTADQITVDWASSRDDAFIKLLPSNYLGCKGDTVTLDVKINKRLEPAPPQGNAEVCLADIEAVTYSTDKTNGSEYFWYIEGGDFTSDPSASEVTVAWDGVGAGRIWYLESNPSITDCEGLSDKLEVVVYEDIVAMGEVKNVNCNGGNDGEITLTVSGGKPGNYTVNWDNGMTGLEITGLVAGTYIGTVMDEIGCVETISLTVTEPAVLAITDNTVQDVRCFQEANGAMFLTVTGGTPNNDGNYNFTWTGENMATNTIVPQITGLLKGNYTVTVTDGNGCITSIDFEVEEPPLLEPDLETLINQPICPDASDGTGFVEAKGGTPDYQFFWSNDPATDQQEGQNFSRGTYTVRIVDANGCETSLDVEVTERFPRIFVPNAFSPNGDGENERFQPVTDCQLTYSIQLFNEWGSVIFSTNDIFEGWDGRLEGEEAPVGKYSYVIFYSGSLNGVAFEETLRGTVRLLR